MFIAAATAVYCEESAKVRITSKASELHLCQSVYIGCISYLSVGLALPVLVSTERGGVHAHTHLFILFFWRPSVPYGFPCL